MTHIADFAPVPPGNPDPATTPVSDGGLTPPAPADPPLQNGTVVQPVPVPAANGPPPIVTSQPIDATEKPEDTLAAPLVPVDRLSPAGPLPGRPEP